MANFFRDFVPFDPTPDPFHRAFRPLTLGAHEKLTTCARIELTTSKTGCATRHAVEHTTAFVPRARKSLLLLRRI